MTRPQPAGWYDDPNDSTAQRYWDGNDWTPHRRRRPATAPLPAPPTVQFSTPPPAQRLPPPPSQWPPNAAAQQFSPPPAQPPQWPPTAQPAKGSGSRRSAIAAIAVVVVLAVAGVLGYVYVLPYFASPENQIQAVVQKFTDAYNKADATGILSLLCTNSKDDLSGGSKGIGLFAALGATVAQEELREQLNEKGTAATTVSDIHVTGDTATASVTTTYSKTPNNKPNKETDSFAREDGDWKICLGSS